MPEIWERQEGESDKAYSCFCAYRDSPPPRNLNAVYREKTGRKQADDISGEWKQYKSKFEWDKRVAAYDGRLERQALEKNADEYAAQLLAFRSSALKRLELSIDVANKLAEHFKRSDIEQGEMTLRDASSTARAIAAMNDAATNVEALILGIKAREQA